MIVSDDNIELYDPITGLTLGIYPQEGNTVELHWIQETDSGETHERIIVEEYKVIQALESLLDE